jgi:hypothetical protein
MTLGSRLPTWKERENKKKAAATHLISFFCFLIVLFFKLLICLIFNEFYSIFL